MKSLLLFLIASGYTLTMYAQSNLFSKEVDKTGAIIFAEFHSGSAAMDSSKQLMAQLHALGEGEEFVLTGNKTDELGFTHHYYSQYYKAIRVAYASYSVHGMGNVATTANGTYINVGNVNTEAKLTEKEALAYATRFINAKVYKWEVQEEERWLQENFNESYHPKGELVVVKDRLKTNLQFLMAWTFNICAHIPFSSDLCRRPNG